MSETTPSAAVDPTDEAGVTAALEHALREIEAAADLSELKTVRLAHTGEKSPLALANRAIGGLDKAAKATAGTARAMAGHRPAIIPIISASKRIAHDSSTWPRRPYDRPTRIALCLDAR